MADVSAGPGERNAGVYRVRHDFGPWGAGAGDRESLAKADAESGHRDEVVDALQTLGANPRPEAPGESDEEFRKCLPSGVVANALDQRTVEFDGMAQTAARTAIASTADRVTGATTPHSREGS